MENRRTHAFLHVGLSGNDVTAHFVACQTCANSCYWAEKGCPCCRTPVVNVIRIVSWFFTTKIQKFVGHPNPGIEIWDENYTKILLPYLSMTNFPAIMWLFRSGLSARLSDFIFRLRCGITEIEDEQILRWNLLVYYYI